MNIKQYIADIETLEKERYGMELTIKQIDRTINSLGRKKEIIRQRGTINEADTHLSTYGVLWIFPIAWGIAGLWITHGVGRIVSEILWVFLIPTAIVVIWMIAATIHRKNKYEEEQQQISRQFSLDQKADLERVEQEKRIALFYKKARNEIYETYRQTNDILDRMYGLNILYGKYRYNLVAIAMFSEYFQSGRCTALEGHEGAYNIYENEIRLGMIMDKLDEIIVRLDRIEQNQYRLFMAITEISKQQNQILSNLDTMAKRLNAQSNELEYISYNTNVARINSMLALTYHLY